HHPSRNLPPESCETAAIGSATGRFALFMSRTPLVNREIGWLSFNERVLQEAADPEVPLIERLKFVGICSSNLEEFFRVRVATLQRMVDAGISSHKMVYGEPKKVLHSIHEMVLAQRERFETVFAQA